MAFIGAMGVITHKTLAPGETLLVVPVVATGTRRQAYLMIRRDLRGRLRRPETVCEASFVPLIDTRDFAPDCVEIKILRRFRAESSRRPPRHRRDACSIAWRCRFLTARPRQDGRVSTRRTG